MRKIYLIAGMWAALFSVNAQQTATFEEIELQENSFYNGSDGAGGFQSGGIWFPNSYNAAWDSWSGFAVSNMKDTLTAGYGNQYSAVAAMGADSSGNFAVAYESGSLNLPFDIPVKVEGFYVTNSVYSYLSMRDGDDYSKMFGGTDGTDPDYFLLLVSGTDILGNATDTIEFYLADFRFENSDEDYIIDEWQWVELATLGVVKELNFMLESTDVGEWGMNTPAYFCIDNFTVSDIVSHTASLAEFSPRVTVFPNPVKNAFQVHVPADSENLILTDGTGKIVFREVVPGDNNISVNALSNMPPGIYYLIIRTKKGMISEKIIKY